MLESLFKLPFYLFALAWNSVAALVNFTLGMIFALIQALAPFATLGLFFVSNEKEARETLQARKPPAISTPADGEQFSQLFEENSEVKKIILTEDKIVVMDEESKKRGFLLVNIYQIRADR